MAAATTVVVTCPVCEEDLGIVCHPVTDWKRGSVRLEVVLEEASCKHIAEHFSTEPDSEPEGTEPKPEVPEQETAVTVGDAVPLVEEAATRGKRTK